MVKLCPLFEVLHPIMANRPSSQPIATSERINFNAELVQQGELTCTNEEEELNNQSFTTPLKKKSSSVSSKSSSTSSSTNRKASPSFSVNPITSSSLFSFSSESTRYFISA
jgi:hypothetical protein